MASASSSFCFQICSKTAWQFKILAILYFYCFIIIFNLTLQQVLLVIELNYIRNFCPQIFDFSIPYKFENLYQKFVMKRGYSTIFICSQHMIFFSGKFFKLKAQYYYILKVFKGNLKNVGQKAIKTNSSSFRNTSNAQMFRYHVIKMNEA